MQEKSKWKLICTQPVLNNTDAKSSLGDLLCLFACIIYFTSANHILVSAEVECLIISGKYNSFM